MPEKETITFFVSKSLKEEFETKAKAAGFTKSTILRQLMKRYIEDHSILHYQPSEITQGLEERLNQIQMTQEKELTKRMDQMDLLINSVRKQLILTSNMREKSLTEEIIDLLDLKSDLRGKTYQQTEQLVLDTHPHLKVLIVEAKKRGEDPVSDAINTLRDQGSVTYSNTTKRLRWSKK